MPTFVLSTSRVIWGRACHPSELWIADLSLVIMLVWQGFEKGREGRER